MRRELVLILAAVAIAVAMPAPAEAQTLVPDIDALIGGDDRKAEDDSTKSDERCGHGVTMICAGETLVGGVGGAAADVVGGAVGAAGDAVLGGVVDWTAALALVVWIELVLREASIYVAVTFLPISFVAMIWRPTSGWAVRLTEWLGAIVLAKFTIAVAFAVAGSPLTHASHEDGGLTTLLAGCAVLLVAALTPWVLLRMLPRSVGAANATHRGVVRQAAGSAIGTATATMITRQAILRAFSSPAPIAKGAAAR